MRLNKAAHARTWAQEQKTHPQYSPAPTGKRIEDLSILEVWRALGGGPLRAGRGRAFWRDGDGCNVQLYPKTGTWKDFAGGDGGGILALVVVAMGCDKREALAWLADNFGIAIRGAQTAAGRREYARMATSAAERAAALVARRDAEIASIQTEERRHLDTFHALERRAVAGMDMELAWQAEQEWAAVEALTARRDALAAADGPGLVRLLQVGVIG